MDKTPGQIAFEAFFSLKLDGRWKVQPDVIKEAWEASAQAVLKATNRAKVHPSQDSPTHPDILRL